ncbi:hypothetical protein L208DRAFT_365646 [Tricholoma matsutake]|nr:hypothetical protein L208DRAFT_365646 [Tricholoma matsutake 945]
MWFRSITISAFLALTSAQSIPSISSGCLTTLAGIASAAPCLNPSPLVQIFVTGSNSSLVTPIDNWLKGLCATGPCSNSTLAAITTNLTGGCSTELRALGLQNLTTALVQQDYPALRNAACLNDNNNGTLCVTETLKNVESVQGPVTISTVSSWLTNGIPQSLLTSNISCTNCVKQTYNVISSQAPTLLASTTSTSLRNTCGASFIDGQPATGISESASQASPSPSPSARSGALTLRLPQSGALVLISSAFAFLV